MRIRLQGVALGAASTLLAGFTVPASATHASDERGGGAPYAQSRSVMCPGGQELRVRIVNVESGKGSTRFRFTIKGAVPLEEWGFSLEMSYKTSKNEGTSTAAEGMASAGLDGVVRFPGARAPGPYPKYFAFSAEGLATRCAIRGTTRAINA